MLVPALVVLIGVTILIAIQSGFVYRFTKLLAETPNQQSEENLPRVAVILCLRGIDPALSDCLRGLLHQEYPDFNVKIVLDTEDDPADSVVRKILLESPNAHLVHVDYLKHRCPTCSAKNSGYIQAVEALDDSFDAVASIDADVIPHTSWLKELVSGLSHPEVVVATGGRWHVPVSGTWGNLFRYWWSIPVLVQMAVLKVAWGGSFVIRKDFLQSSGILSRWKTSLSQDAVLGFAVREHGKKIAFVSTAIMPNREDCQIDQAFRWFRRQTLTNRLYDPAWPIFLTTSLAVTFLFLTEILLLGHAIFSGNFVNALILTFAVLLHQLTNILMAMFIERSVARVATAQQLNTRWFEPRFAFKALAAMLLLQAVFPFVLFSVMNARFVTWRGIRYRIDGPWKIQLESVSP